MSTFIAIDDLARHDSGCRYLMVKKSFKTSVEVERFRSEDVVIAPGSVVVCPGQRLGMVDNGTLFQYGRDLVHLPKQVYEARPGFKWGLFNTDYFEPMLPQPANAPAPRTLELMEFSAVPADQDNLRHLVLKQVLEIFRDSAGRGSSSLLMPDTLLTTDATYSDQSGRMSFKVNNTDRTIELPTTALHTRHPGDQGLLNLAVVEPVGPDHELVQKVFATTSRRTVRP